MAQTQANLTTFGQNDFFRSGDGTGKPNGVNDDTEAASRSGDTGFGIADATAVRAKLDVAGAQILRPVTLANFAANAAIGTAVATVDVTSHIIINQTTAGITLTLPNPANAQAGRLLIVENNGTSPVTVAGQLINNGAGLPFIWSGAAWVALGSASADFWRTIPNALPDGVTDTADSIRRLGNTGIGGAAITEAMPVVTTPSATNNILHLSGSAAGRGQLFFGSSPLSYYLERTFPTVIGNYVDICSMTGSANGHNLIISLAVHDGGFALDKLYVAAMDYNATGGAWRVLAPLSDGGAYGANNFELLVNVSNGTISLRARRTGGANAGTLRVRIEQLSDPRTALTELTTTGTDAAVYATYYPFAADWTQIGNSGTTATASTDGAAQTGNFIGTIDNQPVAIYTNAGAANGKSDLRLYPSISAGAAIAAATDILHIRRGGQSGVVLPQVMSVALGRWIADANSRTRADIRLGNAGVATPDFTAMSLFSQGGLGINGNGGAADWAWATGGGIGRGNGGALLALMGANGNGNVGPHIGAWTAADTYPLYYQLNWTHNNIGMIFDGYYDGVWRYSHTSRAYAIYKINDALNFYGGSAAGVAGTAWTQDLMGRWRYAGATLAGGELDFASIVKNRRIVLFDANAASDHQFYGFGVNNSVLRYQIDSVTSSHIWYAATSATASNELMRLTGAGNLGLGGATGIARLDVNGAAVLRSVVLADIPLPGPIGTAGATVDVASTVVLNQTTNNVALTLPNPANATAGRLLYVTHNGTATGITVAGKSINTGETISFVWDGNSWNPPAYIAPNRAYVYAAAAANTVVANNAATVANWPETTDSGNNSAAGIFTAPRAGFYSVAAAVTYLVAAWNATTYAQISIAVNGADRHQGTATVEKAGNRIVSVNVSATVFLTAGQTLQINVFQNSGTAKNTAGGVVSYYTIVEL